MGNKIASFWKIITRKVRAMLTANPIMKFKQLSIDLKRQKVPVCVCVMCDV